MGAVSAEEILASAVVAAVISSVVSLVVARWQANATVAAAQVSAQVERDKASDEEKRQCRAALVRVVEAWQIAGMEQAEWSVRQEQAGKALGGLFEVATILGARVQTPEFNELIDALSTRSEEGLQRAGALWPRVQVVIVAVLAD